MSRGKPIQVGPAVRLPEGMTWEKLAAMSSDAIRDKGLFPKGFLPLPHPKQLVGGMVFTQTQINSLPAWRVSTSTSICPTFSAGVSAGHLPDLAHRSGRRFARQGGDRR